MSRRSEAGATADRGSTVNWSSRAPHALPLAVLAFAVLVDVAVGPDQVLITLAAIAPLAAATFLGRRATLGYAVLALIVAVLLGFYDQQYTAESIVAHTIRLVGIALAGAMALVTCTIRQRREEQLTRLGAQAASTRAVVQMAETLQRNLLGAAPQVPGLETAVRYLPASRHAQVGGDWYDTFPAPDGTTVLVIGDVAGHDAPAAATMAQTRGMLRGIAQAGTASPATLLTTMDRAFENLGLGTLVTVAVATVDLRRNGSDESGPTTLRWANAGHPAPVLICADGQIHLLEREPDRLLGVSAEVDRADHEVPLAPGDTVLFYTDGLVERGRTSLDEGTAWLLREMARIGREPLERLCDDLLTAIGGRVDDDVALLAIRLPACTETGWVGSPQR
jgi:phosphoserine phosphatase RsbU/P